MLNLFKTFILYLILAMILLFPPFLWSANITFTAPEGWYAADKSTFSPNLKAMVIGKGKREFPPSINLATEPFKGTLRDYLKLVKEINQSQQTEWKDLGTIQTSAGSANLSQVEVQSEWGKVKMMHAILVIDQTAIILTAASLADEFSAFYEEFFNAIRSLKIEEATDFIL